MAVVILKGKKFEISGSEKCILVEPGDGIIQRTGNDMHFNSQVL